MTPARDSYDESYGSRLLAEAFQPTLPWYFRTHTPHRLCYQGSWLWAGIQDEEGTRYACLREWKTEYSLNALISRLAPDPRASASRVYKHLNLGIIRFEKDDDRQIIQVEPAFEPDAFRITIKPQRFHWTEAGGELDLEFSALGPALKYLCPGEREDALYLSEFCRVRGSLQGKEVTGFGGIDCAYGTAGVGWLQSKIYRLLEKHWVVWANRYEDQSLEYGICIHGEADFHLGFVVRDGAVDISGCSVEMEHFEDGFPREARIALGQIPYRFRTTAQVSRIKGLMQWANGVMRPEGDARRTVETFGWLEFFG